MKRSIVCLVLGLFLLVAFTVNGGAVDVQREKAVVKSYTHTIMKPDRETFRRWVEAHKNAPKAFIDRGIMSKPFETSVNLLTHLQYTPSERDQGQCGDCWLWAGTGVMEIAHSVQNSVKDRLSIQYIDSCYPYDGYYACCGGWLEDLAAIYTSAGITLPWSNSGASFQDAGRTCDNGSSLISCSGISTSPSYTIQSITNVAIDTYEVGQTTASNNIKAVLNQNKAVWLGFFLPNGSDWDTFFDFWDNQTESDVFNYDYANGHTWDDNGGGHAVLIVGYDDSGATPYWIAVNSWGTTANRPSGLFRIAMNMNYDNNAYDPSDGYNYWALYFETLDMQFTGCPAQTILVDDEYKLNELRKIRDTRMTRTRRGKSLVNLYYKHAGEISRILGADEGLRMMAEDVVQELAAKAISLNNNETVGINQGLVKSILELADAIDAEASPELKMAIRKVEKEINAGTLFKKMGVRFE